LIVGRYDGSALQERLQGMRSRVGGKSVTQKEAMTRTATQILERGKAGRGERFEPIRLRHPYGHDVPCRCGSIEWTRSPFDDIGHRRAYLCARECGMMLREGDE
jgi:hypothetical protein